MLSKQMLRLEQQVGSCVTQSRSVLLALCTYTALLVIQSQPRHL